MLRKTAATTFASTPALRTTSPKDNMPTTSCFSFTTGKRRTWWALASGQRDRETDA